MKLGRPKTANHYCGEIFYYLKNDYGFSVRDIAMLFDLSKNAVIGRIYRFKKEIQNDI